MRGVFVCLVAGLAVCSQAFVLTFDTFVTGDNVLTGPVATLSVNQNGPDRVDFVLSFNGSMQTGSFISGLWLNVEPYVNDATGANSDPFVSSYTFDQNNITNANYVFDSQIDFVVSPPASRLGPGQSSSWSILGTGLTESHFMATAPPVGGGSLEIIAMIQIQGIGPGNEGSAKWAAVVPEPGTMLALAAGVGALTLRRRKRRVL